MNTIKHALALAALALAACSQQKVAEEPVRPVLAMQVQRGAPESRDVYAGDVRARYETDVGFRVGGKLVARTVDAGAIVRKGQVLARLDPEDARLAASAARSSVAAAESDFATASAEVSRYRELLDKKFISASAFEAKQNAYNAAKGRHEQAQSQAAISANQASYTTLVADADGVVETVLAEPGQVVAAGQPVLRIARGGEREIAIHAPESQLARFKVGEPAGIALWTGPHRVLAGRIREIAGAADPTTRTYTVRVSVLEPPADMRLGMSANVLFQGGSNDLILVPLTALAGTRGDPAVWVVDPATQRVRLRPVGVDQYREDGATIKAGLEPGEWIVTAGVHKLRAEQAVRLAGARRGIDTARNP